MSLPDPFPVSRLDVLEAAVGDLADIVYQLVLDATPFQGDVDEPDLELVEA